MTVKALLGYRLELSFSDGRQGVVPMESRLFGPMFEPLREKAIFEKVFVDEFGVVCWPNGADLDPENLYQKALFKPEEQDLVKSK